MNNKLAEIVTTPSLPPELFFVSAAEGQRFCIYHRAENTPARGAILYVHPFAEELNKTRRMANLQARAFAAMGYAVLQIDLLGCGDSSGEFELATWKKWHEDLSIAWDFLRAKHDRIFLWGLRLGATLALDFAANHSCWPAGFLLWQPVLSGELYITQFLRLKVASEMIGGEGGGGVKELKEAVKQNKIVEVAGYRLNPDLVREIENVQLKRLTPQAENVVWIEMVSDEGQAAPPAAQQVADLWREAGVELTFQTLAGPQFWATQEITDCPALLEATNDQLEKLSP